MNGHNRRWEGDDVGHGSGDGRWITSSVEDLLTALTQSDWIAEAPEDHLLPHLRGAIEHEDSPWVLRSTELRDNVFVLELEWSRPSASMRELRADAFALLGSMVEGATYVHQHVEGDLVLYDIATGMLRADTPFASHGHTLQFRIGGEAVRGLVAGMRQQA